MEKEQGIVEQADQHRALIRIERSSHCATCTSRDHCHSSNDREMQIELDNTLQVKKGDSVEIALPTRSLLKLSMLVYLGPILLLLAGALAGQLWAQSSASDPTLPSVLGGVGAMAVGFGILKGVDKKMRGKPAYSPRILRILTSAGVPECADNR